MMKIVLCCCLLYAIISSQEHELLSEQLERAQKKMLRVSKDRSFLLDRMLQYEKVVDSSSDSDATDVSDSDTEKPASKYVFSSVIKLDVLHWNNCILKINQPCKRVNIIIY